MRKYYGVTDGSGIVGYGFTCQACEKDNNFVATNQEKQVCQWCKAINELIPYDEDEMDFWDDYVPLNK